MGAFQASGDAAYLADHYATNLRCDPPDGLHQRGRDRYAGRIVSDDRLNLYNFNDPLFTDSTPPVFRLEVDHFKFQQNAETVTPWEVHLYFGELGLTDVVDPQDVAS